MKMCSSRPEPAGLTLATGVSRLGDTFIRAAQQRAEAEAGDKQLQVEDAQRRYEAQARVADELSRRAADPDWMRSVDQAEALSVWEAAQLWGRPRPRTLPDRGRPSHSRLPTGLRGRSNYRGRTAAGS